MTPILNYTTEINVPKTAGEIQEKLAMAGARRIMIEFGKDHAPEAISFEIDYLDNALSYRLPTRWEGVYASMLNNRDIPTRLKTEAQAKRVGWRIVRSWIEAQLAMIEAGTAHITEIFMPYMLNDQGQTAYEAWQEHVMKLGSGEIVEGEIK